MMNIKTLSISAIVTILAAGCAPTPTKRSPITSIDKEAVPMTTIPSKPRPSPQTASPEPPAVQTAPVLRESEIVPEPLTSEGSTEPTLQPSPVERSEIKPVPPAVVALVNAADTQARSGKLDGAAASLERALRIEPHNAVLWQKLADIRLQQKRYDQALQLAARSNSYASGDTLLQARTWRIIAKAKEAKGDDAGAQQALQTADSLER